jgi:hypothetical protein
MPRLKERLDGKAVRVDQRSSGGGVELPRIGLSFSAS